MNSHDNTYPLVSAVVPAYNAENRFARYLSDISILRTDKGSGQSVHPAPGAHLSALYCRLRHG